WITSGFWPPGLLYVVGVVNLAGIGPLHAGRIVALAVGTLTVPAFEALVERVFDRTTGWLAAMALAALPLHVELSASSLSEAAAAVAAIVVVAAFPLLWTAGNALATGDPLFGFTMARRGAGMEGVVAIAVGASLQLLAHHAAREVGVVVAVVALVALLAAATVG